MLLHTFWVSGSLAAIYQSLVAVGHSEAEAADEAAMVRSQLAYARGRAGKAAAAAEQLKQIVRSR